MSSLGSWYTWLSGCTNANGKCVCLLKMFNYHSVQSMMRIFYVHLKAWGVRKITLLDSGRVAMSNPLRQSLYTLEDCINGGELKAIAAVKSLKHIFPGVVMSLTFILLVGNLVWCVSSTNPHVVFSGSGRSCNGHSNARASGFSQRGT